MTPRPVAGGGGERRLSCETTTETFPRFPAVVAEGTPTQDAVEEGFLFFDGLGFVSSSLARPPCAPPSCFPASAISVASEVPPPKRVGERGFSLLFGSLPGLDNSDGAPLSSDEVQTQITRPRRCLARQPPQSSPAGSQTLCPVCMTLFPVRSELPAMPAMPAMPAATAARSQGSRNNIWPSGCKISGFRASNWFREVLGGVPEAYLSDHRRCPSFTACHRACSMSTPSKVYDPGSTASTDARIASAGPFYPGIQLGSTSMVHLRPILAMLRSSGLPCFYVGGCGGAGQF